MNYYIYITNNLIAEVSGVEAAWAAYQKTCELADMLGKTASLVDGETGEVIAYSDDWEEENEDYEPDIDECGFDPYEGSYTYDC